MARFYYEDSEQPWRPDAILRRHLREKPQRHPSASLRASRDTENAKKALDLGMGYGRNAVWLAERGYEVEGWERDKRYVAETRREWRRRSKNAGAERLFRTEHLSRTKHPSGTGRLVVRHGDFVRGKWGGKYDVVVISQALHQVRRSEALKVLRKAATRLRAPLRLRFPRQARGLHFATTGQGRYGGQAGGQAGGRLFLLVKLTSDRHFQRVRRDPAWKPAPGEKNTFLRPEKRRRGRYHPGRPRTPQMVLSALEPREIRRALTGLRVVRWRTVVLKSDWEEDRPVTHTVAEVVAERR